MMSIAASAPLPDWIMSYHFLPCGSASTSGSPAKSSGKKPMPSEWSATTRKSSGRDELHRLAARRGDLLAPGEAVGIARGEPRAECARVHRERGVQVRVAEERAGREVAARVGRVGRLGGKRSLDLGLV